MQKASLKMDQNSTLYKNTVSWLNPKWEQTGQNKTVLQITALNSINIYQLVLESENIIQIIENSSKLSVPNQLIIQKGILKVSYSSNFQPLTPYNFDDLLNKNAMNTYKSVEKNLKNDWKSMQNLMNGLRFLAYKEKFLAGAWCYLTYFGRDSLLSLRMITPIVNPQVLEAGINGMSNHLSSNGEISHEEDLGDQAYIDQINQMANNNDFNLQPSQLLNVTNNYNMVDENYLAVTLLNDYYELGGRDLFSQSNSNFVPILKNMNYLLSQALGNEIVPIHNNSDVGDWRDSNSGIGFGRYSVAINTGHIPSALYAVMSLINNQAWDKSVLQNVAQQNNFTSISQVLENTSILQAKYQQWMQNWRRFHVVMNASNQTAALNRHRAYYGLPALNSTVNPYPDGFLAISLDNTTQPIPILNSDSAFALLDNALSDEQLNLSLIPFNTAFPDGLYSAAGNLVASATLAPTTFVQNPPDDSFASYLDMFNNTMYHGEVVWGWQEVLLNIALQKQLGKWVTKSPSTLSQSQQSLIQSTYESNTKLLKTLSSESTSELWSWQLINGTPQPAPYGQSGGGANSNAEQLWSVAAIGPALWQAMVQIKNNGNLNGWEIAVIVVGCVIFVGLITDGIIVLYKKQQRKGEKKDYEKIQTEKENNDETIENVKNENIK